MSRKIALIEDESAIRKNYADALSKQGYQVMGLESRQEALKAFQTNLPDLAIIDISLGDDVEGGFDVCRVLRSKSNTLPIIFLLQEILTLMSFPDYAWGQMIILPRTFLSIRSLPGWLHYLEELMP